MFELRDLMKRTEGVLKKEGVLTDKGSEIEDGLRHKARSLMEQDMVRSMSFVPLNRLQDRKDLKPWHGKESDAEVAFNFSSYSEAQDMYDFVINSGLLEMGEVRLVTTADQHSVHFASHVMVMKPDVIQAVMLANRERIAKGSARRFNRVAEDIATVLRERKKCRSRKSGKPGEVTLGYAETVLIDVIPLLDEGAERADASELYTRYWDGLESVAENLAGVIEKLPHRQDITEEDASDVIHAVKFLSRVQGTVVEVNQSTFE